MQEARQEVRDRSDGGVAEEVSHWGDVNGGIAINVNKNTARHPASRCLSKRTDHADGSSYDQFLDISEIALNLQLGAHLTRIGVRAREAEQQPVAP